MFHPVRFASNPAGPVTNEAPTAKSTPDRYYCLSLFYLVTEILTYNIRIALSVEPQR